MTAVVIVNYRGSERTVKFVREECSVIAVPHKVIIVDNASTQESFDFLSSSLPDALILSSIENLGFARGNNLGAEAARLFGAETILFVNNDISFLGQDVAGALAARLSELENVALIGPEVVGTDGRLQSPYPRQSFAMRHLLPYWGKLFYKADTLRAKTAADFPETAVEGPCAWVSGSCFLVDAKAFFEAGMFDPATFLYAEEAILSERLARVGKLSYYYPQVSVLHEHGAVTRKYYDRVQLRRMKFESESYYYRNYCGTPSWQIALGRFTLFLKRLAGR